MHAEIQHRAAPDAEASSPLRRPRDLCTAAQGRGSVRGLVWGSCSPCPWARGCFALVTPHGKQSFPRCILATGFWVLLQADARPLFHQVTLSNVLYFPYIFLKVCMKDTEILQQEESCLDIFVSKECLRLLGGVGWG